MFRFLLALCCALFASAPAAAYWEYGHGTVARIALDSVRPETRRQVEALLRQGRLLETPTCPISTIEQASVWADCIKPMGDRFSFAFSWHYQNVEICRPFDLKPSCKDGNCVSAQVERNARLLADKSLPTRDRVQALAFLVHFVGDLAQPMHNASRNDDKGGNDVKVNYGLIGGRTNLHAVWDGYLPERAITTPPAGARALLAQIPAEQRAALAAGTVEEWSREAWQEARTMAYGSLGGDPCGPHPATRPTIGEAQVQEMIPALRLQVLKGGLRLARLLDDALLAGKAPGQRRD